MRLSAGRRPARQHPEVIWLVGTLVLASGLVGLVYFAGAKPPPREGSLAALEERTRAAEASAARAARRLSSKVAELHNVSEQLHRRTEEVETEASGRRRAESEAREAEAERWRSDAKLNSSQAEVQQLQAERAAWLENRTDDVTQKLLVDAQARLAEAQKQNVEAQAERAAEAQRRHRAEGELADSKAQLADSQAQLREAEAKLQKRREPVEEGGFLRALTGRPLMVLLAGTVGCLSVIGPSSFVRVFLPVVGSAMGGLMASGCLEFCTTHTAKSLMDSMALLLDGGGGAFGYLIWAVLLGLGIARWALGVECSIYAIVDDVVLSETSGGGGGKEGMSAPLLQR